MLRLLADENFNGAMVRGIKLRMPNIDVVRVQDVGLDGWNDDEILEWAAVNDRIVLSHDCNTMIEVAAHRVDDGLKMPGLFMIESTRSVREIIDELAVIIECSDPNEWLYQIVWLPL